MAERSSRGELGGKRSQIGRSTRWEVAVVVAAERDGIDDLGIVIGVESGTDKGQRVRTGIDIGEDMTEKSDESEAEVRTGWKEGIEAEALIVGDMKERIASQDETMAEGQGEADLQTVEAIDEIPTNWTIKLQY